MSNWRTLGYVPDSDEEDEDFDTRRRDKAENVNDRLTEVRPIITNPDTSPEEASTTTTTTKEDKAIFSTASRLEELYNYGLQTVRDVLGPPGMVDLADESPLSSPPSSISDSPQQSTSLRVMVPPLSRELAISADGFENDGESNFPRRNLRIRAPIQQHPYMLEDAKYRQLMKDRGIRPVNLPSVNAGVSISQDGKETQQTDDFQSSQLDDSGSFNIPSSPASNQSVSQDIETQESGLVPFELPAGHPDDGLPDLFQLLHEHDDKSGRKYRAQGIPTHLQRRRPSAAANSHDSYGILTGNELHDEEDSQLKPFRVPPSPPRSDGHLETDDEVPTRSRGDATRHLATPSALPTPSMSSGIDFRKRRLIVDSGSDSSQSADEGSSPASKSSQTPEDESQGMQWIRRQLRGVLPPSVLQLDKQKKPSVQFKQRHTLPLAVLGNEKGVARRVNAKSNRSVENSENVLLVFHESDTSDSDSSRRQRSPAAMDSGLAQGVTDEDNNMIPVNFSEEHEIDPMLPSTGIVRNVTRRKPPRQQRIDSSWAVTSHRRGPNDNFVGSAGRMSAHSRGLSKRRLGQKRRKVKHQQKVPEMSVLHAPGIRGVAKTAQPQFLKVAARQARKITYQSRLEPSTKFFVLATEEDTQDVNQELRSWTSNQMVVGMQDMVASAKVFGAETTNEAGTLVNSIHKNPQNTSTTHITSATELANLKKSTSNLLSRINAINSRSHNQKATHNSCQSVDAIEQGNQEVRVGHLRSLFAYRNRSGQGQFLSRTSQLRAAQVESSHIPSTAPPTLPIRTVLTPRFRSTAQPVSSLTTSVPSLQEPHSSQVPTIRKNKKQSPRKFIKTFAPIHVEDTPKPLDNTETTRSAMLPSMHITRTDKSEIWVQKAIQNVKDLQELPITVAFRADNIIGYFVLSDAKRKALDVAYDPRSPQQQPWTIETPRSQQYVPCSRFDAQVKKIITDALDEIYDIISAPDSGQNDMLQACMNCVRSFDSIVRYIENAAYFQDSAERLANQWLTDFASDVSGWVRKLLAHCDNLPPSSWSKQLTDIIIHCLNWCVVLLFHLQIVTRQMNHHMTSEIEELCKATVGRVLDIVFRLSSVQKSIDRIIELISQAGVSRIDNSFPEAESVVVAWHICKLLNRHCSMADFYAQLQASLARAEVENNVDRLALTLSALCLVLPLANVTVEGRASDCNSEISCDASGYCFNFLATNLQLTLTTTPIKLATADVGEMLEAVEDVCLKMRTRWKLNPTPSSVVAILRAYTWNAMLPFHTYPKTQYVFEDFSCLSSESIVKDDNDFYKFLELINSCVQGLFQHNTSLVDQDPGNVPGKIRNFIFSLIPNNAQICDAEKELKEAEFLALKNHFALFVTLFTVVPEDYQPRLGQLEQQVDFSKSHAVVCKLAIAAWRTIAGSYVQRSDSSIESLERVGCWMNTMLHQTIACYELHHRLDTGNLLKELFSTLTAIIAKCESELKARELLQKDILNTLSSLLDNPKVHQNNGAIMIGCLQVLHAYAETAINSPITDTLAGRVQLMLKKVIQQTLSRREANAEILRQLMAAWFVVAQNMVRTFHKHWNDFVNPHSGLSIDFLSSLRDSHATLQTKQCFYSDLIRADQSFVFLECRPVIFMTWIATLLLPIQSMRFEHILTNSILKYERDSLMIRDLADRLFQKDNSRDMTLQDVADSRIVILRHIIQNIYGQQTYPEESEEEWLAGGLDLKTQKDLLHTMFKVMKATWLDLREFPTAQSDYTSLVHAILNEMETYPIPGFKIDSWFYVSGEFPRPIQTLDNIFKCRYGESAKQVDKDAIRNFRSQVVRELNGKREHLLLQELLRVFHCTDRLRVRRAQNGSTAYSIDFKKQSKFMQIVFPAFIEYGSRHPNSIAMNPILELMIETTKRIQFRIDNLYQEHMQHFLATTAAILCAIRKAAEESDLQHRSTIGLLRYTRTAISAIYALVEFGIECNEYIFEMCIGNILGIYRVVRENLAVLLGYERVVTRVYPPNAYSDGIEYAEPIDRSGTTFGAWDGAVEEEFDLVPRHLEWALFYEAGEPELNEEEMELREYARGQLEGLQALSGEKVWGGAGLEEEVKEFLRELKGRMLAEDLEEDEDEEET